MITDNFPQSAVPVLSDLWTNELVRDFQNADEAISTRGSPKTGVLERVDAPRVLPQPFPPGGMRIECHCRSTALAKRYGFNPKWLRQGKRNLARGLCSFGIREGALLLRDLSDEPLRVAPVTQRAS